MLSRSVSTILRQATRQVGRSLPLASTSTLLPTTTAPVHSARMISTSLVHPFGAPAASSGPPNKVLASLIEREVDEEVENLKEEQSQLEEVKEVADKIQQRFHVKETPGSSVIKLHGKDGAVKVVVQFDVQDTTEDELNPEEMQGENADNYTVGIRSLVTMTKGSQKLMFSVVFTNVVWVEKVSFDGNGRDWNDDTLYWSEFTEFPEDVQSAFTEYLAEHGVDDDMAVYVSYFAYQKEKQQYIGFLEGAKSFVASG